MLSLEVVGYFIAVQKHRVSTQAAGVVDPLEGHSEMVLERHMGKQHLDGLQETSMQRLVLANIHGMFLDMLPHTRHSWGGNAELTLYLECKHNVTSYIYIYIF